MSIELMKLFFSFSIVSMREPIDSFKSTPDVRLKRDESLNCDTVDGHRVKMKSSDGIRIAKCNFLWKVAWNETKSFKTMSRYERGF